MTRREILKAGLGAGALFLPLPYGWVWAQSAGAMKLLQAPKRALVVGNSKYRNAPELKNPANDARAIGGVLKAAGFEVATKLDTGREEMIAAIRDHVRAVEQKKGIGLFYFAGHGVQLAWRNYLLPVDAVVRKIDDVVRQSIDIAQLMEGLAKASNPMNVIILDACRENPFGGDFRVEQKGLSQMDAPGSTLLAYATSPGNVASDGDGANGLYTENLLREIQVPEAKIEDVFKRVRLGVRRKSNGAQIPWESTSLEEDFWFLPPKEIKAASDAEKEKRFAQELALWERAQKSSDPAPLEDYLRRYPSGNFSELAQLQLDRVLARQGEKRIEIAPQLGNPYTKGSATEDFRPQPGYSRTYRILDLFSRVEQESYTETIASVTDSEIHWDSGAVTDLLENLKRTRNGQTMTGNQSEPFEYALGKRWTTRYDQVGPKGGLSTWEIAHRIAGRENVTVPTGTFNAYVIESQGYGKTPQGPVTLETRRWKAPGKVRGPVAIEQTRRRGSNFILAVRRELVSFKQP